MSSAKLPIDELIPQILAALRTSRDLVIEAAPGAGKNSFTPVFIGFGLLPLICATIVWTLTGPLRPAHPESYA